eukprot:420105_1
MNTVLTDQVRGFEAIARTEHGLSASIFNLGGLLLDPDPEQDSEEEFIVKNTVEITCLKEGSCAGSIVILKQCGVEVTVKCSNGACPFLVIALPLTDDCKTRPQRKIRVIGGDDDVSPAPDHPPIYVWCPSESKKPYPCVHDSGKLKRVEICESLEKLKDSLESDLKELNKHVPPERYSVKADNMRWVLESKQLSYWGGVSLEAAFGTITVAASGAITG